MTKVQSVLPFLGTSGKFLETKYTHLSYCLQLYIMFNNNKIIVCTTSTIITSKKMNDEFHTCSCFPHKHSQQQYRHIKHQACHIFLEKRMIYFLGECTVMNANKINNS